MHSNGTSRWHSLIDVLCSGHLYMYVVSNKDTLSGISHCNLNITAGLDAGLRLRHQRKGSCRVRAAEDGQESKPQYGLLIECDGVLCDTHREGHRVAFNRAFSVSPILSM